MAVTSLFVKLEHELHGEGAVIDLEMLEASLSLAIGTIRGQLLVLLWVQVVVD